MSDTEEVFELDDRKAEIVPALHKHEGIWTIYANTTFDPHFFFISRVLFYIFIFNLILIYIKYV